MLRYLTAGESHGPALVATMEGIPAHVRVGAVEISEELRRRRLGAGRGARMSFEADELELIAGFRHGETLGDPIAIRIDNSEWRKWRTAMAPGPVTSEELAGQARAAALTRPRPGHADLAGMQKYDFDEARPVLERASARETAARVALGAIAKAFLKQALDVDVLSHVVSLGPVAAPNGLHPGPDDLPRIDSDSVRCADPATSKRMVAEIEVCRKEGDTLGGVVEVLAYGVPAGLGSHSQGDRRLDARLAGALMGIQAIKGVELGDGFDLAHRRGSQAHDWMEPTQAGIHRMSDHAGGTEGGMSTGQVLRVRAAMKPIATVPRALPTVDVVTGQAAKAHHQRSDVCAVPAAGVVAEAMVALVLAECALEKFGGDSVAETHRNAQAYLDRLAERGLAVAP
ncbi:chorismate synthase [Propionibacterium sp. NM47_B9-13]|jgi:chorismate synthase|uniref:Chorismate synthase n=1 Tax=Cutibacterium modestum HL044PA1 TaxID=765109 RepID=A0ABP2K5W2_9ACTN|nr:chorismate synthase [Cutibacterium modestum]TGY29260.1 chorismate synthase [Propionibacterium sp. NM47_B9-13]AOH44957.1 chorismate synthase [Cutibacterium modestum]EFS75464.1 chorismate synthase [Cutibacterium modestum HL037PA2]EFS91200.1 chorismate synthase [Cutibacterium modestum HL044PA1]EFT16784.1 chorismate synthase [Cutibacterium modestum HL037PA3]